jgi:hypothetical protein
MKPRKMLCYSDAPYIESLIRLIETQSKPTIINWCVDYAERYYLPIWEKHFPADRTPHIALETARKWPCGEVKMQDARGIAWDAWNAARAANAPASVEAAAGAIANAVLTCHIATHSIRVAFYGAAAVAYDSAGVIESAKVYDVIAAEECARLESALRAVAVENDPNPVPCKWRDMNNVRKMEG